MTTDTDTRTASPDTPLSERERLALFWDNEARECRKLEMHDLAATCARLAAGWRFGGATVDWGSVE